MSSSAKNGTSGRRSGTKNLNLYPARGSKGFIIDPSRLQDLRIPVDTAILSEKNVVVVFGPAGTSVGLVDAKFHISFESGLEDLELLGRARGLVQRTIRKSKASDKKEIELSFIKLLKEKFEIGDLKPTINFGTELPNIVRQLTNIENSNKIISSGTSTQNFEEEFRKHALELIDREKSALLTYASKLMSGDKSANLEDLILANYVPHHFFRKTAEGKLTKEFVNNVRKIFFTGNLSSTMTISLRESLNEPFVRFNEILLEKTSLTLNLVRDRANLKLWSTEPIEELREGDPKYNRFYRSVIYVVPTKIDLRQFLFQKRVTGNIPRNDMLPALTALNDAISGVVYGRFQKTLLGVDFWESTTGEKKIPVESLQGDIRDRLNKATKNKIIPLETFFPYSEELRKLIKGSLPSKILSWITFPEKIEEKKEDVKIEHLPIKGKDFSISLIKPLTKEERKGFEVFRGKLVRWFETKEEKRAPRGLLRSELHEQSTKLLIDLVRKDPRYKESIPRIKGYLRSFSSSALQIAAAKILLSSREESVVIKRRQDYEEESSQDAGHDEDRDFILNSGEIPDNGDNADDDV